MNSDTVALIKQFKDELRQDPEKLKERYRSTYPDGLVTYKEMTKLEQYKIVVKIRSEGINPTNPDNGGGQFSGGAFVEYYLVDGEEYALELYEHGRILDRVSKVQRTFF